MALLTEEQSILRDQARAWAAEQAPVTAFRDMRAAATSEGFAQPTWQAMVEMGWTGILVPEEYGGADLGYLTFGLVLEELGKNLTASPLFASAWVGVSALRLGGSDAQKQALLPSVVDGSQILTLAVDESGRHNPTQIATSASTSRDGYVLNGAKTFVLEGMAATTLIVAANLDGATGLFLVPADASGVSRSPMQMMDDRGYARVQLDNVTIGADARLAGGGDDLVGQVLNSAAAGVAAEMMGNGSHSFEMTLEYLKTRKQFGAVIGSFQALGHRAAELYSAMELARSCVEAGLAALDRGAENIDEAVALSKAQAGEFLHFMSNQLIQIHGGIGMTDEFDAGLLLKRARLLEATYGNRAYHRDRYAKALGF